jgi:tRNA (guanine-N7-)-methyltransferase
MKPRYLSLQPLILWRQVEHPVRWDERFGRTAPLQVEIGFGSGDYLVRQAAEHPEMDFVGIEVEWQCLQRALRKLAQAGLSNVRLILGEALPVLIYLFPPASVAQFYALFPCPWPKERHARHRLFSTRFLRLLHSRLNLDVPGASVQIVTDFAPFRDWVLGQVPGSGFEAEWHSVPPQFGTKYERKWIEEGQEEFYELKLVSDFGFRISGQASEQSEISREVCLETYRISDFDPVRFTPQGTRGEIVVEFKEFLYDPVRKHGMQRVIVVEENVQQDFWIEIAFTKQSWSIRPAAGCGIVPTVGVQRALDLMREGIK